MLRILWLSGVLLLVVVVSLTVEPPLSFSQAGGWSQPVRLSPKGQFASFPDVTADVMGRVHVVWSSGFGGYDSVMYTANANGKKWSVPNDIAALRQTAGSESTRPTLLADPRGFLHLAFRYTTIYYSRAQMDNAFSAASWLPFSPISSEPQKAYFSRLAIDGKGTLHFLYTEYTPSATCVSCYHVYYRQSNDIGLKWSDPLDISGFGTGAAKIQVVVDGQDYIHVVWEAGEGGDYGRVLDPAKIMYAASYDGGETWTAPIELVTLGEDSSARNIALGLDGKGNLLVVWLIIPEDVVYYQISSDQGRSWSQPQPIPGVWSGWATYNSPLDAYAMATDSAGNLHLVLSGRINADQENLNVLHLNWNGYQWSNPKVIKSFVGDVPEWPRIAVGLGNQLHVVWFERDQAHIWNADSGRYSVWYAFSTSNAPTISPVEVKQPTPTFTVTPTQQTTATPSASPIPTLLPVSLQKPGDQSFLGVGKPVYSEKDYLILLGKILVPPTFFLFVSLVVLLYRRR